MYLRDLAEVIDREESLFIKYYDFNMNMNREYAQDEAVQFIRNHGNVEVRKLTPVNHRLVVEVKM